MERAIKTKNYRALRTAKKIMLSVFALLVAGVVLFPILWMLPAAFKGRREIFAIPVQWLPVSPTLENFKLVFTKFDDFNFLGSLGGTLGVSAAAVVLSLAVNMTAAYAFARIDFRGKKFLWAYFIFTMFVPGITILLTSFKVVAMLGMLDTFWVLVLPGVTNAYNIFFFRQFFFGVPTSLEEAAVIDGAGKLRIFLTMFVPLSVTPMVIIGASVFMSYWNSFLWPTLTITDNVGLKQVMQVIRVLNGRFSGNYGVVVAATILSLLGPLAMFAFAQKKIVQGIVISGLK